MEKNSLDSIDIKYCFKTNPETLEDIQICENCFRIALPYYRSSKNILNYYGKSCYISINKNLDNIIPPSIIEIKLLAKLVISCVNFDKGCSKDFSFKNLEELMTHQSNCDYEIVKENLFKNCKRCKSVISNQKVHDCFLHVNNEYLTTLNENEYLKKEVLLIKDSLKNQIQVLQNTIKKLSHKINYQAAEIHHIKQTIRNQHKANNPLNISFIKNNNNENEFRDKIDIPVSQHVKLDFRLIYTMQNFHTKHIRSLVELKDGSIASASQDSTIRIWDTKTGVSTTTLLGHNDTVHSLIELKDGRIASASFDKTIKIWNLSKNLNTQTLVGHKDWIYSIIELNNAKIASASSDRTIKIWDLEKSISIQTFEGHSNYVRSLIELKDGKIASGSNDKTIKLWDVISNKCTITLIGHENCVWTLLELKDGMIASGSQDSTIKIWDLNNKKNIKILKGHTDTVLSLIQLFNENIASCSSDKTIKIWEFRTNQCIQTLNGHLNEVCSIIQLKSGKIASSCKHIKIWGN